MKRRLTVVLVLLVFLSGSLTAQGMAVFDFSNWLSAIDQVYATYDQIQNTINMVENQYKQIQKAREAAKGIEWDNPNTYFKFTGLQNLRSDLQGTGQRMNRLISMAQNITSSLQQPSLQFGNVRYSVADLFGLGDENKNIYTALGDTRDYINDSMRGVIDTLANEMTDEQKMAIWAEYGVSPSNYLYAQQVSSYVAESAKKALARTSEDAKNLLYESQETAAELVKVALETTDEDGNSTEGAFRDANLALLDLVNTSINSCTEAVADFAGAYASKMLADQQLEEQDNEQLRQTLRNMETINSRVSDSFRKLD